MSRWQERVRAVDAWNLHNQPNHEDDHRCWHARPDETCPIRFTTLRQYLDSRGFYSLPGGYRISGIDVDEPNFRSRSRQPEITVAEWPRVRAERERLREQRALEDRTVTTQVLSSRARTREDAPGRNNETGVEGWTTEDLVLTQVLITKTLEVMKDEHKKLSKEVDRLKARVVELNSEVERLSADLERREAKRQEKKDRRAMERYKSRHPL